MSNEEELRKHYKRVEEQLDRLNTNIAVIGITICLTALFVIWS